MPRSTRLARRGTRSSALLTVLAVVATALAACSPPGQPGPGDPTYAELGRQAVHTLEHSYYDGDGAWNVCVPHICGTGNVDWGVDSLTYALYFHWSLTHDRGVRPIMSALRGTAVSYSPAVDTSSDVPVWDTIADVREYQVTGDVEALAKAEAAFRFVSGGGSRFALGACPAVDYQLPGGGGSKLKTLETASNSLRPPCCSIRSPGSAVTCGTPRGSTRRSGGISCRPACRSTPCTCSTTGRPAPRCPLAISARSTAT